MSSPIQPPWMVESKLQRLKQTSSLKQRSTNPQDPRKCIPKSMGYLESMLQTPTRKPASPQKQSLSITFNSDSSAPSTSSSSQKPAPSSPCPPPPEASPNP
ncbi:hypothetical protein K402DRAFT_389258 [Aulographum hederae CBS 113979]|uniref:Uncharacterized protein n=1 Tax=Aulographum hederae CBS 113979 TaxID=1176131 RepID=A0A6G1HD25_9PEZI|nr:hypothetical protein K402DRAFT_389258 [Aulographum hederae CBS 113979]